LLSKTGRPEDKRLIIDLAVLDVAMLDVAMLDVATLADLSVNYASLLF
jgi:hypothetical protein